MSHRRFADHNYSRHCWECIHAKDWHKGLAVAGEGDDWATCDVDRRCVGKYDSPNNPCSIAGGCWYYDNGKETA